MVSFYLRQQRKISSLLQDYRTGSTEFCDVFRTILYLELHGNIVLCAEILIEQERTPVDVFESFIAYIFRVESQLSIINFIDDILLLASLLDNPDHLHH